MREQHLSDEAIAACADGALRKHASDRAIRHAAECAECAYAIAEQRAAKLALRAAAAPSLPGGLVDRLRAVPDTTPIRQVPAAFGPDGSAMFATFGSAAFVPSEPDERRHLRPMAMAAAGVAVASALTVGLLTASGAPAGAPRPARPVTHPQQAGFVQHLPADAGR